MTDQPNLIVVNKDSTKGWKKTISKVVESENNSTVVHHFVVSWAVIPKLLYKVHTRDRNTLVWPLTIKAYVNVHMPILGFHIQSCHCASFRPLSGSAYKMHSNWTHAES